MRFSSRVATISALTTALLVAVACSSTDRARPSEPSGPIAKAARPSRRAAAPLPPTSGERPPSDSDEPSPTPPSERAGATGSAPTAEDRRTFDEANRMRVEHGLRPFRWNDRLFVAARDHSAEQARHGYMGHGSPDPARDELEDRLRVADCGPLRTWAEVVAWGYTGPASVVNGWMNSRGHRKILLDPALTDAGFSRVGDYFTGDFGTPRATRP